MMTTLSQVDGCALSAVSEVPGVADITICVCTYQRMELLERLLQAIAAQRSDGSFRFSCVIVDNDVSESGRSVVERMQSGFPASIRYSVEPARNFALVRNHAVSLASGDLLAFIDDDEVPREDWLLRMVELLHKSGADAVLGPVRPYFDRDPPSWIMRGRVCERPAYPTGTELHWNQTRTGNVLLRAGMITEEGLRFDPAFASGGEDVDFFRRAAEKGKRFVWCEEAAVYELVPESRLQRSYYLKRALLQGRLSAGYAKSFWSKLLTAVKAFAAAVAYTAALPVLFLLGDHLGMRYLIKDCHHIARLLTTLGLSPSFGRDF